MSDEFALVVAGGKGTRFGSNIPKQFLELSGKPVLLHTLEAFYRYSEHIRIILVLPSEQIDMWNEIAQKHQFARPVTIQTGGDTRFQSVKNGLQCIRGDGYVAIHDGVRPLVSNDIIARSFALARQHRAAVAAVPPKESLRIAVDASGQTRAVDRSLYRVIQTPQTFEVSLIKKAYDTREENTLTDDASVAEKADFPVFLFEGDYRNIKITSPEDLIIAEALLAAAGPR